MRISQASHLTWDASKLTLEMRPNTIAIALSIATLLATTSAQAQQQQPAAPPPHDNMFVADDFTNEFIGAQLIIGSVLAAGGTALLITAAVRTTERDDILSGEGGIEACDTGTVDPDLCQQYRDTDDQLQETTISGSLVLMTGVVSLTAALVAYATSVSVEDSMRKRRISISPLAGPNGIVGLGATYGTSF